ncbi:TPA: hypothetical protein ACGOW9_001993, partial [Streptococcus suis]
MTVSKAGKVSGQSNLAVGTHDVDSIIKYNNNNSEVRSGDRFWIAVMDAVKTGDVTKNLGDTFTADSLKTEVLNKVDVRKGNIPAAWGSTPNPDYATTKKIVNPSTGQETSVPTTPGTHAVTVRVTNNQGRYKDVVVNVTIPNPNQAPTVTINSTATNVQINDGSVPKAIFVFGKNQGTTEDINGATGTSPVADPAKATRKVAEMADADGTIASIGYHDTKNDRFDLASATDPSTTDPAKYGNLGDDDDLSVNTNGNLTGHLIYGPGAKSTRLLKVTDNGGATTNSDTFLVLGYTDKVADPNSPVAKVNGIKPTAEEIFAKMAIDVNSSYPTAVPNGLVIPTDQYRREIVGYRTAAGQPTTAVTSADGLPETGDYEVRVKTTNIYGQEIFNWVRVDHDNNQLPTISQIGTESGRLYSNNETNRYLFVFGKTEGTTETETGATTAAPAVNKANAKPDATIVMTDDGSIASIAYDDLSGT